MIEQPNGEPLTAFKRGAGPHTGVHLIFVRDDLARSSTATRRSARTATITELVMFPAPGPYRVVVDAYPDRPARSRTSSSSRRTSAARYLPQPLPPFARRQKVGRLPLRAPGKPRPPGDPGRVPDDHGDRPGGQPARFTPWYGALAHAIFFRRVARLLPHARVRARREGCTSIARRPAGDGHVDDAGEARGRRARAGRRAWRLFLQCRVNGHVLTAPFTLKVT